MLIRVIYYQVNHHLTISVAIRLTSSLLLKGEGVMLFSFSLLSKVKILNTMTWELRQLGPVRPKPNRLLASKGVVMSTMSSKDQREMLIRSLTGFKL